MKSKKLKFVFCDSLQELLLDGASIVHKREDYKGRVSIVLVRMPKGTLKQSAEGLEWEYLDFTQYEGDEQSWLSTYRNGTLREVKKKMDQDYQDAIGDAIRIEKNLKKATS